LTLTMRESVTEKGRTKTPGGSSCAPKAIDLPDLRRGDLSRVAGVGIGALARATANVIIAVADDYGSL
jgi:hypothetical protein